jgi:hypothetical protein
LLINPNTTAAAPAAITAAIAPATTGLKTQARRLSLLSQVLVLGADLYQSYGPQIFPRSTPYAGRFPDVGAKMVFASADIFDVTVLIVQHCIMDTAGELSFAPDAYLKAKFRR